MIKPDKNNYSLSQEKIDSDTITKLNHLLSKKQEVFFKKKLSFSDAETFFPEGLEMLFLAVYVALLPYIAGLIFLLLFFSNFNKELMQSLYSSHSFFLTWCVGYEILAIITLIVIFKKFIVMKLE